MIENLVLAVMMVLIGGFASVALALSPDTTPVFWLWPLAVGVIAGRAWSRWHREREEWRKWQAEQAAERAKPEESS